MKRIPKTQLKCLQIGLCVKVDCPLSYHFFSISDLLESKRLCILYPIMDPKICPRKYLKRRLFQLTELRTLIGIVLGLKIMGSVKDWECNKAFYPLLVT